MLGTGFFEGVEYREPVFSGRLHTDLNTGVFFEPCSQLPEPFGNGGYLVTTDCDKGSPGVKMTDILEIANNSKCKNRVIILDCCFAAKMGETLLMNNSSILGEGVTIIAESQTWQASEEDEETEHGVFTDLLIQGLHGRAADVSGNITSASLYSFVDQLLGAWQQRPVFKTNSSQFLPIKNRSGKKLCTVMFSAGEEKGNDFNNREDIKL